MEINDLGPNHKGFSIVIPTDDTKRYRQRIRAIRVIEICRRDCSNRNDADCIIAGDIRHNNEQGEVELGAHCVCGDLGALPTKLKETFPEAIAETIYDGGVSVRVSIDPLESS